ncbi:MAG: 3-oxoacyl-ACP reductase family protein [Candidatus Binatus sp.]|uniref:SDR family NAD(P)-dependent oxidoreductase n=1 Tax=Candidatus Binatus sp. TaxID=2811406 RepID=UPI002722BA83|nr:3-oxoacyl-ACP reductase family protein [Candidatus Binatus sp.]MDO8433918.1 3-oxoacyl-ACP reductase family protein [Candidatus Binatus sp.]
MNRLNDKVAIVTGAAQGIGLAIAQRLASEGAKVALADIQFEAAERSAAEIRATGGTAIAVRLDVTEFDDAVAAADRVENELGPIDVLVNNAGWDVVKPFLETMPDLWNKVIAINYLGPLNCCRAIAPRMQSRGSGKIVSISSDAARVGSTGEAVYAGCKAAVIGFSKTLARELARYRINVNVVCPGPTETALLRGAMAGREKVLESMARGIPFRRLGQPQDLAGAVAFFASSDSDFVTGQVLSVSGGLTMVG